MPGRFSNTVHMLPKLEGHVTVLGEYMAELVVQGDGAEGFSVSEWRCFGASGPCISNHTTPCARRAIM